MDSRKKKKTAAIFFDIEKVYNKVNREKTLTQPEIKHGKNDVVHQRTNW